MDPIIEFYDADDVLISDGYYSNIPSFGLVSKGVVSAVIRVWVWNDRELLGADSITTSLFHAIADVDDVDAIFDGTAYNGNVSMLEARSQRAIGLPADRDSVWTPIGPINFLTLAALVSGTAREIELRLNVPPDAGDLPLAEFKMRLQYELGY